MRVLPCLAAILLSLPARAATDPEAAFSRFCATCGIRGADTFASQSGQFIVHGRVDPMPPRAPAPLTNMVAYIELEPQLVAITAERAKRAFLQELRANDAFQSKVHIILLNQAPPDQPITIVSKIYADGLQYQVGIPRQVEHSKFVKGLVQTLLLEYANRGVRRSAELPTWLVEGMTRQVLSSAVPTYVVNKRPVTLEFQGMDRLSHTRSFLQTNSPLTIHELSFNELSRVSSEERARYESCAHLLVHELLRMERGPYLLARFLQTLPNTLNWQTAFYSAYQPLLRNALDVEKWWTMTWLQFKKRQENETWPLDYSLQRLDTVLLTSMEFRRDTNSLPQYQEVPLQEVISRSEFPVQKLVLTQKAQQLYFVSLSLSPEALPLVTAYQETINDYLSRRALNEYQPTLKSDPEQRLQLLVKSTLKKLDELDRAREALRAGRRPL